jgi:hypothetical protein
LKPRNTGTISSPASTRSTARPQPLPAPR